jgi:hypothetical protein
MKKTYQAPKIIVAKVTITHNMLESSPANRVQTGGATGNEYTESDVSYSRRSGFWDDED